MNINDTINEIIKLGAQDIHLTQANLNPELPASRNSPQMLPAIKCTQLIPGPDGKPPSIFNHQIVEPSYAACFARLLRQAEDVSAILAPKNGNAPNLNIV